MYGISRVLFVLWEIEKRKKIALDSVPKPPGLLRVIPCFSVP